MDLINDTHWISTQHNYWWHGRKLRCWDDDSGDGLSKLSNNNSLVDSSLDHETPDNIVDEEAVNDFNEHVSETPTRDNIHEGESDSYNEEILDRRSTVHKQFLISGLEYQDT